MKYRITIECLETGVAVEREGEEELNHPIVIRSLLEMMFPQVLALFIDQQKDQRRHELPA